jgi:phage tail sheath protein FI
MSEYLSPGVYVEEIDAGPKPIAPVATSTAGAVGVTRRGPDSPTLVTNYGEFVRTFGGPLPVPDDAAAADAKGLHYWQAAESIKAFFDEGGARVYFQRVVPGGAAASKATFHGGLYAGLAQDVEPADTKVQLSHVFGVKADAKLALVGAGGSPIGTLTVTAVDYASRTVTLNGPAGLSARRAGTVATITAPDALTVLDVTAASEGLWGDALSVQILPVVGARKALMAAPGSAPITTKTTAAAAVGATKLTVAPVAGAIAAGMTGLQIQIAGGPKLAVTSVVAAAPNVTLTLAAPLAAAAASGSTVSIGNPATNDKVVTVDGADRLYKDAIVQLEGAAGVEFATIASIAGSQVTLTAKPAGTYLEGDGLTLVEADVNVRYSPADGSVQTESFSSLRLTNTIDPSSLISAVNLRSRLIALKAGKDYDASHIKGFPAVPAGAWATLGGGGDALSSLTAADVIGVNLGPGPGQRTGIQALEGIDEVAICIAPGMWDVDVRNALIIHCETLGDRFAILDPPPLLGVQEVEAFRSPIDTKFAALYYPWVEILDPRPGGTTEQAPPSGFMAGVYARVDVSRGVHKAPANEVVRSIRGLAQSITKREQDILNPQNINVLRAFPGRGNRVWGARVLTSDSAWKYVPVRRLFLMIEESIDEATQWVVFEPNDEPLWARVRWSVSLFLESQWRIGALQGATAGEAFFVACDRSTMTQDDIDNGRLIVQVGIAPVKPAEFVIFRVQQKTLEPSAN